VDEEDVCFCDTKYCSGTPASPADGPVTIYAPAGGRRSVRPADGG